jgi:CRP/FNR family transcriptional regulator
MDQAAIIRLLDQTELFGGLSEKSKEMLAGIAIPKTVSRGQTIFSQGDTSSSIYLLGTGSVEASVANPNRKVVIRVVQPGEIFGEVTLFEQDRYPATTAALRKSMLFILPKKQFHSLLENSTFRNDFIVFLMAKQRYLINRLAFLQSHEVDTRFFLFLKEHYGRKNLIKPGMSKKDMAAAIGTIPETLSRLLLRLKQQKMLSWESKEIVVAEKFWKTFEKAVSED